MSKSLMKIQKEPALYKRKERSVITAKYECVKAKTYYATICGSRSKTAILKIRHLMGSRQRLLQTITRKVASVFKSLRWITLSYSKYLELYPVNALYCINLATQEIVCFHLCKSWTSHHTDIDVKQSQPADCQWGTNLLADAYQRRGLL